jgi:hypothetical protein
VCARGRGGERGGGGGGGGGGGRIGAGTSSKRRFSERCMSTDCSSAARSLSMPFNFPAKFLQLPASATVSSPAVILVAEPSAASV